MIASHFPVKRLKYCARALKRDTSDPNLPFIGLEQIEAHTGRLIQIQGEEGSSEGLHFNPADVLFSKLRPYLAKAWLAEFEGKCTSELLVLRPTGLSPRFLFYVCLSDPFVSAVTAAAYGTKMPRASPEAVVGLTIPAPSHSEQRNIAAYLDYKIAAIDEVTRKKHQLIKTLDEQRHAIVKHALSNGLVPGVPMKDTGHKALGKVPAHWEVWKLSHAFDQIGSGTTPASYKAEYYGGPVPWVTTSELREQTIEHTNATLTGRAMRDHAALVLFPAGTVVVAMYGATVGRVGILGLPATLNQACCGLAKPRHVRPAFLFLWLVAFREYVRTLAEGAGQPNISQQKIRALRIAAPSLDEQDAIIARLSAETAQIDRAAALLRASIERLSEYRRALISAAVTGERQVTASEPI